MIIDDDHAVTRARVFGDKPAAMRWITGAGAAAIAGLIAVTAVPASASETAAPSIIAKLSSTTTTTALPSLGRHIRRAARLPFNMSLKFGDKKSAATAKHPNLTRFVRARGHGSEATAVDGYGPDRLVESLTFPTGAPVSNPKGTALANVDETLSGKPDL